MTPRAKGKEWAEKEVYKRLSDGWSGDAFVMGSGEAEDMLRKEHARSVRIVKRFMKGYTNKNFNGQFYDHIATCEYILHLLQRGRGKGGVK